jgi:hypothetical protein
MNQSSIHTEVTGVLNTRIPSHGLCNLCLALAISSSAISAPETPEGEQHITPPENWYQVEVIVFTQQGNKGSEAAPQDYQLDFPDSWQELIDPRLAGYDNGFPLAEGALLSIPDTEDTVPDAQLRVIPRAQVLDPAIRAAEGYSAQSELVSEAEEIAEPVTDALFLAQQRLAEAQALDKENLQLSNYKPRYETQLILLDREFRDLNESAYALDRRGYNVVFHNAWRFASEGEENDQWILLKAGQRLEDRHQIEGSIRFYKSRFLHFQTDLWLLQFGNDNSHLVELPDFPVKPQLDATKPKSGNGFFNMDINSPELAKVNSPELGEINSSEFREGPAYSELEHMVHFNIDNAKRFGLASFKNLQANSLQPLHSQLYPTAEKSQPTGPKNYPVSDLWTLKRSMRLDEQEVYYIDHPRMGIMVSIKSHEPLLLNPQPAADLEAETSELITE